MKRKMLFLILSALMMVLCLSMGLAQSKELDVLADWENYLYTMEDAYAGAAWAYGYAQAYVEDPSWENLVRASAAAGTAWNEVSASLVPIGRVSIEEYAQMTAEGRDVEVVGLMVSMAQDSLDIIAQGMMMLHEHMNITAYDQEGFKFAKRMIEINRQDIALQAERLCVDTNYILTQLSGVVDGEAWWAQMEKRYPFLYAHASAYTTDTAALERRANETNEQFEEILNESYANSARYTHYIESYTELLNQKDYAGLRERLMPGVKAAQAQLIPDWVMSGKAKFTYIKAVEIKGSHAEEIPYAMGDDLEKIPERCQIVCEGISREAFIEYADALGEFCSIEWMGDASDEQFGMTVSDQKGERFMSLSWEKDGTAYLYFGHGIRLLLPMEYFL